MSYPFARRQDKSTSLVFTLVWICIQVHVVYTVSVCINDGFPLKNGSCHCPAYTSGVFCDTWHCINGGQPRSEVVPPVPSCSCPPGQYGVHCEPVTCVPSTTDSLPVIRSLGFIFVKNARFNDTTTYNDYNQAQFTAGTLAAMDELTRRAYPPSAVSVQILGTPSGHPTDCGRTFPSTFASLRACIQYAFVDDMDRPCTDLDTLGPCFLSTVNIRNTIALLPIQTILFIYTNVGISDFTNTAALNEILQMAITKRVQINVIFGFPEPISGNVYDTPPFTALSELSKRTLGYYIPVYDATGSLFGISNAQQIITRLIPDLTQSPIRAMGSASNCNNVPIGPFELEIDALPYIVVQTNDVGVSFPGAINPDPLLTAGYRPRLPPDAPAPWRLYQPGLSHFYFLQTNGTSPCSWSVYAKSNRAAYLSFTQNALMDSGSPLAIKKVPNTVVAYVHGFDSDSSDILQITNPALGWNNLNGIKRYECQFNYVFGEMPVDWCHHNTHGVMHIQSSSQSFSEAVPFLCVDQENLLPDQLSLDSTSQRTRTSEDSCMPNTLDPSARRLLPNVEPRTFAIAVLNRNSVTSQLFDRSHTLKNALSAYLAGTSYSHYMSNLYMNDVYNATMVSNYLTEFWRALPSNIDPNDDGYGGCNNNTLTVFALNRMLSHPDLRPYSDVFVFTDQLFGPNYEPNEDYGIYGLYERIQQKRVKLNFILFSASNPLECIPSFTQTPASMQPYLNLAQRSGGFALRVLSKSDIVSLFSNDMSVIYNTATVAQNDNVNDISAHYNNKSRYALIAISPNQNQEPTVQLRLVGTTDNASGIVLNPDIRLGYDFGLWYLPQNLTSSTYRFTLSGTYISLTTPVLQLRLVELNTQSVWQWQYALAFTADLFYEAIGTYPSFTGANLYPVMTTGFTPSSSVSITVLSAINQSIILDNQQFISRPNCFYDKVLQTPWKCSSPNELYYATLSVTIDDTRHMRTVPLTCYYMFSPDSNPCLNGGTINQVTITCMCAGGWTGEFCGVRLCYNGGNSSANPALPCNCSSEYTGDFCEHISMPCPSNPYSLRYEADAATWILVVQATTEGIRGNLRQMITAVRANPFYAQQYILIAFNDAGVQKVISTTVQSVFLKQTLAFINSFTTGTVTTYSLLDESIMNGLRIQVTQRSLVTVIAGSPFQNANPTSFSSSLSQLIAEKRATIQIHLLIPTELLPGSYAQRIASLGAGIVTYDPGPNSDKYLSDYISGLLPADPTIWSSILDVAVGGQCGGTVTFHVDHGTTELIIATLNTDVTAIGNPLGVVPSSPVITSATFGVVRAVTTSQFGLWNLTLTQKPGTSYCSYQLNAISSTRYAYGFNTGTMNEERLPAPLLTSSNNTFIFYVATFEDSNTSALPFFPNVDLAPIRQNDGTFGSIVTKTALRRDQCSFTWSQQFDCNNNTNYLAKIWGVNEGGDSFQRTFPVTCLSTINCTNGGTFDANTGCTCPSNWRGYDCSIPICQAERGTYNAGVCNCKVPYHGVYCELS